ncbi:MAG TPA: serine protease [Candidatus Obscuribacterales bacterium]
MADSSSDALNREWQLAKGFGRGVAKAPGKAWDSWEYSLALAFGTGVAAYGLGAFGKLASPALSAVIAPTLARVGTAFNLGLAMDAATWLYRAGGTAADTWTHSSHLESNIGRAEQLGTEAATTAALFGTGLAGFKLAGWKTPFYTADNLDTVFGKLEPGDAPRMQVSDWLGRHPSIEPAGSELAHFYHEQSPAVGHLASDSSTATAFYAHKSGLWFANYHAIEGKGPLVIQSANRALEAKLAVVDPRSDAAVLVTNPLEGVEPVKLAASGGNTYTEKPSVVIGYGDSLEKATITTTNTFRHPGSVIDGKSEFEPMLEPAPSNDSQTERGSLIITRDLLNDGSSGSPIFDRNTKEVLGMYTGHIGADGTGISVEHLSPLLREAIADVELGEDGKVLKLTTAIKAASSHSPSALLEHPVQITNRDLIHESDVLDAKQLIYPKTDIAAFNEFRASAGMATSMHSAKLAYDQTRG